MIHRHLLIAYTLLFTSLIVTFVQAQEPETSYFDGAESIDSGVNFSPGTDATFTSLLQPRLQTPADAVAPEAPSRSARSSQRSSYVRLARAPSMFGDSITPGGIMVMQRVDGNNVITDVPLGGGRLMKVGENNKPLPTDRVYFVYNGFQNAATFIPSPNNIPTPIETNLNRYTVGFEKTFFNETCSIDVRLPIVDDFQANDGEGFTLDSGNVGDLVMFFKQLMYQGDHLAVAGGLGVTLPTGSNVQGTFDDASFVIQNETVHLLPYIGFLATPNDDWFITGFLQLDFATNGNDVVLASVRRPGELVDQNLFHADISIGRWLMRNEHNRYGRGVALVSELHYTTSITDSQPFSFNTFGIASQPVFGTIGGTDRRFDVLNLTLGMHFEITEFSNLRVAAVAPLRDDPDRQFDSEIQVSFNRQF